MLDDQLDMFVCPRCRQASLAVLDQQTGVMCLRCRLVFPVRDGVPFLSQEDAVAAGAWFIGMRGEVRDGDTPAHGR